MMTEAFARALASLTPDFEDIIGAYVGELIDDVAERVVRPAIRRIWSNGYRPDALEDLKLIDNALSDQRPTIVEGFSRRRN